MFIDILNVVFSVVTVFMCGVLLKNNMTLQWPAVAGIFNSIVALFNGSRLVEHVRLLSIPYKEVYSWLIVVIISTAVIWFCIVALSIPIKGRT